MPKKRKKKKHHDEHMDESWLVPYADILTLLLALFIVLFASSSVDATKFHQLSNVFNEIFTSGSGVMDYSSPVAEEVASVSEKNSPSNGMKQAAENGGLGKQDQKELSQIQQKLNEYIQKNKLSSKLRTSLTDEGLLVTIRDNVLFDSGSAEVRKQDGKISREISDLLVMNPPRTIVISGHTDNVPIQTYQFNSNWDLSVMRAVNFMKLLLNNNKLNPAMFSAKGYGEFKPVASNETKEGRAKNRRVEILIMPRTSAAGNK
ncbi:flagellar motor protein MotB [Actinomycetes bacterium NPDC127524]